MFIVIKLGMATIILLTLGKTLDQEKQSKPSPFDKKFKNQAVDLAKVIFNDSVSCKIKNWVPQLINSLQVFNLLLLSITHFTDLCNKIKYAW